MELLFLGAGSAFTLDPDNFQSNLLFLAENGKKLLIDCGTDIRFSLTKAGYSHSDITDIYISHLHSDHVGGLEYIGFVTKFDPNCEKPTLYLSQDIAVDLWHKSLAGGMEAIEGELADLDTFFQIHPLKPNGYFIWENIVFNLIKLNHVNTGFMLMPAYGLFFEIDGQKVFLTTDTKLGYGEGGLTPYYQQADLIFHDCEISQCPSPVHTHYGELAQLPPEIKAKMWLYGYQQGERPSAQADGFLGFVERGQRFSFGAV
ncbi:MAG: MBL fold metallo-hydrolase [Cyanobacteriota bacterium]|nr:MBL fold metallo-hydrolase [Cyanobacteriota bacterium]